MIFDIKDAFLITGGLIFAVFGFVDYFVKHNVTDPDSCNHCFADYQSTGIRKCIDCGYEETIKKTHYPHHQR